LGVFGRAFLIIGKDGRVVKLCDAIYLGLRQGRT
jgi:hypothetical protein